MDTRPVAVAETKTAVKVKELGITKTNVADATARLKEAIGAEWVETDPAVLTCYSRDFTITVGKRPNIVTLPETTEDVRNIIKIAADYGLPVVPLSTGFNHGGLALPRWGGILVDLKRMDRILDINTDNMTVTIQPHVRNAALYAEVNHRFACEGIRFKPALPLTMGSCSTLANYVARGGSGGMAKYGNNPELISSMTWVTADGEVLKLGPQATPGCEDVAVQYGPGPDISGMFINADGMFGICTEMVIQIFPEHKLEKVLITMPRSDKTGLETCCEFLYQMCRQDFIDFIYKAHGATAAVSQTMAKPEDAVKVMPHNIVFFVLSADDEDEMAIKEKLAREVIKETGMFEMPQMMMQQMAESGGSGGGGAMPDTRQMNKIGKELGNVMRHRGAFQWIAFYCKVEKVPELYKKFEKLVEKYWKSSDPNETIVQTLTGCAIQGPLQFARCGTLEVDFWWDQGNPEDVKRAIQLQRKTAELMIKNGAPMWRNMYGLGEIHFPMLGHYWDVLKATKKEFDPLGIMHPDIDPVTDDYI